MTTAAPPPAAPPPAAAAPAAADPAAAERAPHLAGPIPPLVQRAAALLAAGRANEALRAASDACHATPDQATAHYVYGQAWLALGEPAQAQAAFAAAIQCAPGWADAYVNWGLARYRQGAIHDAKTAMRTALQHVPDHQAALANLGAFQRISGESEAAEATLRAALARDPGHIGARLNLAADLLQQERARAALDLLDPATRPTDLAAARHWHLQRALAFLQAGAVADARVSLAALDALGPIPAALAPLRDWRYLRLALAEGDAARARREAARMEADLAAMGPDAVFEHRVMSHYDLAKYWSSAGDPAAAFRHWSIGHKLLQTSQPFSRAAHAALIDTIIRRLDRARLSGPRAANHDPAPVFIVGMPRSGTTLCEQILAAHAQAHGAGERTALSAMHHRLAGGDDAAAIDRLADLDAPTLDRAAEAYLAELHALAPGSARVIDKMPGNYMHLGLVALMLPGARIIHCARDPRDIGLSIFTFRFYGHHPYAHDLGDLGWTIAQHARLMAHWKAAVPNPILTVRLSDWVTDFDATLERVLAHVGLPPDPNCARFHEQDRAVRTVSYAQVRQPVNARGLGRWRGYARELAPLIAELQAGGALADWEPAAPAVT